MSAPYYTSPRNNAGEIGGGLLNLYLLWKNYKKQKRLADLYGQLYGPDTPEAPEGTGAGGGPVPAPASPTPDQPILAGPYPVNLAPAPKAEMPFSWSEQLPPSLLYLLTGKRPPGPLSLGLPPTPSLPAPPAVELSPEMAASIQPRPTLPPLPSLPGVPPLQSGPALAALFGAGAPRVSAEGAGAGLFGPLAQAPTPTSTSLHRSPGIAESSALAQSTPSPGDQVLPSPRGMRVGQGGVAPAPSPTPAPAGPLTLAGAPPLAPSPMARDIYHDPAKVGIWKQIIQERLLPTDQLLDLIARLNTPEDYHMSRDEQGRAARIAAGFEPKATRQQTLPLSVAKYWFPDEPTRWDQPMDEDEAKSLRGDYTRLKAAKKRDLDEIEGYAQQLFGVPMSGLNNDWGAQQLGYKSYAEIVDPTGFKQAAARDAAKEARGEALGRGASRASSAQDLLFRYKAEESQRRAQEIAYNMDPNSVGGKANLNAARVKNLTDMGAYHKALLAQGQTRLALTAQNLALQGQKLEAEWANIAQRASAAQTNQIASITQRQTEILKALQPKVVSDPIKGMSQVPVDKNSAERLLAEYELLTAQREKVQQQVTPTPRGTQAGQGGAVSTSGHSWGSNFSQIEKDLGKGIADQFRAARASGHSDADIIIAAKNSTVPEVRDWFADWVVPPAGVPVPGATRANPLGDYAPAEQGGKPKPLAGRGGKPKPAGAVKDDFSSLPPQYAAWARKQRAAGKSDTWIGEQLYAVAPELKW